VETLFFEGQRDFSRGGFSLLYQELVVPDYSARARSLSLSLTHKDYPTENPEIEACCLSAIIKRPAHVTRATINYDGLLNAVHCSRTRSPCAVQLRDHNLQ